MPRAVEVIINSGSGNSITEESSADLRSLFTSHGVDASFHFANGGEELARLAKRAAETADVIVAGGGDGTISTIAVEVANAGKTLGVIPLGTLNNFSKDLGIPQTLEDSVATIATGIAKTIDLAEVNGRPFINNSSIGLYPQIVKRREEHQRLGYGKWYSAFWAGLQIFRLSPFLKVRIELDGKSFLRKTPFVFVGNNEYEMDLYNIGRRESLDEGKLSVYVLRRSGRWGVVLLLWHTLLSALRRWEDFEEVSTCGITIQTRKESVLVAFDGEIARMESPLEYRVRPKALKVIVPAGG